MQGPILPPEQIDDFIILRVRTLISSVRRTVAREVLQNEELSILEWQLLFSIARFGSCHLAHVTRQTSIDPAHGSRAASALEKMNLITRHEDPENRRRKLMTLTPEGVKTFERIWPKARKVTTDKTGRLSKSEFQELKRLLDLLNGTPFKTKAERPDQRTDTKVTKEEAQIANHI